MNRLESLLTIISLLHVSNAENESEEEAKGSYSDVANSQEVILSSQSIRCREDKALCTLERSNLILVVDPEFIASWFKASINSSPEFSEIRQSCSSHPNNKMFIIMHVNPLDIFIITISTVWHSFSYIFEFEVNI